VSAWVWSGEKEVLRFTRVEKGKGWEKGCNEGHGDQFLSVQFCVAATHLA